MCDLCYMSCMCLILIGLVIFFLLSHAGFIFSWLSLPVENEVLSAACMQLGEGGDLQIVSTNTEQSCAISPSARKSILPESRHVLLILMLLFYDDVVFCSYEIVFVQLIFTPQQCRMSECEGHYLAIHPFLGFCAARKKGPDPYCISWAIVSKEHPDKQVAALMWAPHGPDTPNLKLPSSPGIILYCFPH